MTEASRRSGQLNLWDTLSSTPSLVSESGPTHSDSPAGPTIAPSGPARAPVSRSRPPASAVGSLTLVTSGPSGSSSSASAVPPVVLGEQVAGPDGRAWFDAVSTDLEGAGYAVGAANLCAAGVGAPHIRQRLYFVAHADDAGLARRPGERGDDGAQRETAQRDGGATGAVAHADAHGVERLHVPGRKPRRAVPDPVRDGEARGLGDALREGARRNGRAVARAEAPSSGPRRDDRRVGDEPDAPGADGPWADVEWLACADGKSRPAQPGIHPLAHGAPGRVGRLRAYGNAIVAEVAATFIRAVMDAASEAA